MTTLNSTETPDKFEPEVVRMTKGDIEGVLLTMRVMYRLFGGVRRIARDLSQDHSIAKEVLRAIADRGQHCCDEMAVLLPDRGKS